MGVWKLTMLHIPKGRVRFGLTLANRSVLMGIAQPRDLLRMAEEAEASGLFEHVWAGDSLMAIPRLESITLLSAIAARTSRIRIGVGCMASLPSRDPIVLAYQWASLDVLSGGRTILGACMGSPASREGHAREYRNTGITSKDRALRMEENIIIMRKLWTEDSVTYEGHFHKLNDARVLPRPIQNPPPVWVVSNPRLQTAKAHIAERGLRRVARLGDGWMTTGNLIYPGAVEEFRELRRRIMEYSKEYSRDLTDFPCAVYYNVNINEDRSKAFDESKRYLEAYYSLPFSQNQVENWVALGPPAQCVEQIRKLMDVGFTDILLGFPSWNPKEQFKRLVDKVLPKLD